MAEGCQAPPHKIKIVAIIGEAGCGKDTIMQEVLRMHDYWWHEIISYTSRPPRDNEKDGVNYYFLSEPEFCDEILNDNMLEWTVFNNWYYGTGIKSINPNNINIGVFNPAGIKNLLKNENLDIKVYRITCSEKTRIIR